MTIVTETTINISTMYSIIGIDFGNPTYSFSNMIEVVELEKILEKELRRRGKGQSAIQQ